MPCWMFGSTVGADAAHLAVDISGAGDAHGRLLVDRELAHIGGRDEADEIVFAARHDGEQRLALG
ncbi:hypothetical protein ACVWW7_003446 [Bradyrhizobium sp. LM6.9]